MKYKTPDREGHFWGKLLTPDGKDKRSGETIPPSTEYEVVIVVDNNGEGDEKYMAMVPGCSDWEPLGNFIWGPEVSPFKGDK